eukprot:m.72607 g.72607  ORF g.72607 m.72607 type:complete len:462 (-) comp16977_c0_seq3:24-1409(-)
MPKTTEADFAQISKWSGIRFTHPKLLWDSEVHGRTAASFHTNCDNKGPTFLVVQTNNDSKFGGYTTENWVASGAYKADPNAFLFCLTRNGQPSPLKLARTGNNNDIYCHANYGPTFGNGHDIVLIGTGPYVHNSGTHGFQKPANGDSICGLALGQNTPIQFTWAECYSVVEDPDAVPMEPWVKINWNGREELIQFLSSYKPLFGDKCAVPRSNILFMGSPGVGKSSFINAVDGVCKGRPSTLCPTGRGGGLTTYTEQLRKYIFIPTPAVKGFKDKPLNFSIWDTMGWHPEFYASGELGYILDGNIPDKFNLAQNKTITPRSPGFVAQPTLAQQVHHLVLLVALSDCDDADVLARMRNCATTARARDVRTSIILTRVDERWKDVGEDVSRIYTHEEGKKFINTVANATAVTEGSIFLLKNYSSEQHLDSNIDVLTMFILKRLLESCDDFFNDYVQQNPGVLE